MQFLKVGTQFINMDHVIGVLPTIGDPDSITLVFDRPTPMVMQSGGSDIGPLAVHKGTSAQTILEWLEKHSDDPLTRKPLDNGIA